VSTLVDLKVTLLFCLKYATHTISSVRKHILHLY
jgi:hypothetical protein